LPIFGIFYVNVMNKEIWLCWCCCCCCYSCCCSWLWNALKAVCWET